MASAADSTGGFFAGSTGFGEENVNKQGDSYKVGQRTAKFLDPANVLSVQDSPLDNYSTGAYGIDQSQFQLGNQYQQQYGQMGLDAQRRQAAQMRANQAQAARINTTQDGQSRAEQFALAESLKGYASGRAPSAAEMTLRNQMGRVGAMAQGQAAGMRGVSPAMANYLAGQQASQAQLGLGAQVAATRAQEQQAATQALAGVVQGARQQDIALATGQAGLQQQTNLANLQAAQQTGMANLQSQMQQQQMNDQLTQYYMSLGMSADQAQMQANMQSQELAAQQYTDAENRRLQATLAQSGALQAQQGATASGIGGMFAAFMSDERLKENVDEADDHIKEFLSVLAPKKFDYKSSRHGGEENYGFMAQDAERSKAGKSLIIETKEGKAIDGKRALMMALASAAHLNKRLSDLEART